MALLQIAEPGQSAAPHQHRLAAGIDLGTTHSLVASVSSAVPRALADEHGQVLLPSVVHYSAPGATPLVGADAASKLAQDPLNTIASVKRLMGRSHADVVRAGRPPYALVEQPGMVGVQTAAGLRSPIEVSADILGSLRARAEGSLGGELTGVVITVPAYFDDAQRQATKDAARLAGLQVLRLLNEPTAAAIAYGLDKGAQGTFLVYDLGGGTFDVSVLQLSQGVFEVRSTGGDSALGGDDFDRVVALWLADQQGLAWASLDAVTQQHLLISARAAKEALSAFDAVDVCGQTLTGEAFGELVKPLVQRTLSATKRALKDAQLTLDEVDGIVLVGGSTRMPVVRRAVADLFGREPLTDLNPDEVVALGAAIQANALVGNGTDGEWLLLDVCPLSLGLETMGGLVEKVIPRNTTLPAARAQDFTTFKDGQTAMSLHVLQGERESVKDCRSLARFELRGIPPMVAGAARIRVSFQIDADGLLSVTAREQSTGVQAQVEVKPAYGLNDEQIARMLADSVGRASEDMALRMLREAQVDARRLLDATEAALKEDGDALLAPPERQHIVDAMNHLADQLETNASTDAVKGACQLLNHVTTAFAARRMDASVRQALSGRALDTIT